MIVILSKDFSFQRFCYEIWQRHEASYADRNLNVNVKYVW